MSTFIPLIPNNINNTAPIKAIITAKVIVNLESNGSLVKAKHIIDSTDEVNILEIVRFKKEYPNIWITVVSIANGKNKEILKRALVLGANEIILLKLINYPAQHLDGLTIARILRRLIINEGANLVLSSQLSSDTGNGSVGPTMAAILCWKQLSNVSKLLTLERKKNKSNRLTVQCHEQMQYASISISLPCVLMCSFSSNNYNLIGFNLLSTTKKIKVITLSKFNVNANKNVLITNAAFPNSPRKRRACKDVNQLMKQLLNVS